MKSILWRRSAGWVACGLMCTLVACGGGSSSSGDGKPASILVNAAHRIVGLTETTSVSAVVLDASGMPMPSQPITWTVGNPSVASVSASGLVTPIAQGTVTVQAASVGLTGTAIIEVVYAVTDVDFSKPVRVSLTQGLLHGLNASRQPIPPLSVIRPLAPAYWRGTPYGVSTAFVSSLDASYDVVLSDLWGYPSTRWPNGKPWIATSAYTSTMTSAVTSLAGSVSYWEIWNEPDLASGPNFWDGTEVQFFATYLATYRLIRQQLGASAIVVGPSLTQYDEAFLDRFAAFCIANGCEANALSWHENGTTVPTQGIVAKVAAARARYGPGSANAALNVKFIHINEYTAVAQSHSPVASLLYLQYFEHAAVDAVARACWNDSAGTSECFNNSLDGLITPSGANPRSAWYGYKLYAQGTAGRVQSLSALPQMLSIASAFNVPADTGQGPASAQLLTGLGDASQITSLPATLRLGIRLAGVASVPWLAGKATVSSRLYLVGPSGESASSGPSQSSAQKLEVCAGSADVVIEAAQPETLYELVLAP